MIYENVRYDKRDVYNKEMAPLIEEAVRECYDIGIPVIAVAAVRNDEKETEYAGKVILPSTLGINIYTDVFTGYPEGVEEFGDPKTVPSSEYDMRVVEPDLFKGGVKTIIAHAERIQSVAWVNTIPFFFLAATKNIDGVTQFQGAQMYHKTRYMELTDDRLTPIIYKKVGYDPYGNVEVVSGED